MQYRDLILIADRESMAVLTVGQNMVNSGADRWRRAEGRAAFVRAVKPYLRFNRAAVIICGRPAWFAYAALSGHWWGDSPGDACAALALQCRALIESRQAEGCAWRGAHELVRAAGDVLQPYLCVAVLDASGAPMEEAREYSMRLFLVPSWQADRCN